MLIARSRRARVRAARPDRPRLSRLHGRRALSGIAGPPRAAAAGDACSESARREQAIGASTDAIEPRARSRSNCSTRTRPSTTSCSRPTPAARSASSPRRFRSAGSRLVMTADNHNSVNGLGWPPGGAGLRSSVSAGRELRGAEPAPSLTPPTVAVAVRVSGAVELLGRTASARVGRRAQRRGYRVLLDAAAFAATSPLSFAAVPADFVALSFYKLFGYPTGVGALVARRDALAILRRRYFGGGTVEFVSVQNRVRAARPARRRSRTARRISSRCPPFATACAGCASEHGEWTVHVSRLT